jgi:hypothetical protein
MNEGVGVGVGKQIITGSTKTRAFATLDFCPSNNFLFSTALESFTTHAVPSIQKVIAIV